VKAFMGVGAFVTVVVGTAVIIVTVRARGTSRREAHLRNSSG
jgi:hypothetical protein